MLHNRGRALYDLSESLDRRFLLSGTMYRNKGKETEKKSERKEGGEGERERERENMRGKRYIRLLPPNFRGKPGISGV